MKPISRASLAIVVVALAFGGCGGSTKTVVSIIRTSTTTVTKSSSTAAGGVEAIRQAYRRLLLAEYFGPPADVCDSLTPANQIYLARLNRAPNCLAAARPLNERHDPAAQHPSPTAYRQIVDGFSSKLRVVMLQGMRAKVLDGYGSTLSLVQAGGVWRFDRGSVPYLNF